jgi:hypothetical protein
MTHALDPLSEVELTRHSTPLRILHAHKYANPQLREQGCRVHVSVVRSDIICRLPLMSVAVSLNTSNSNTAHLCLCSVSSSTTSAVIFLFMTI